MTGPALAAAIGDVLADWATTGYWPPRPDQPRLDAAMHAHHCHPDFTYAITTGATALPPSGRWGSGWVENVEHPDHGRGSKPSCTSWMWRRPKTPDAAVGQSSLNAPISSHPTPQSDEQAPAKGQYTLNDHTPTDLV